MTYELPLLLSSCGFAFKRDAAILSNMSGTKLYTKPLVILGMELEFGTWRTHTHLLYKTTYSYLYTQQNTVPGTYKSN